jgi:hypothetical protein
MAGQPAAPQLAISVLAAPPRHAKAEKSLPPPQTKTPKIRTSAYIRENSYIHFRTSFLQSGGCDQMVWAMEAYRQENEGTLVRPEDVEKRAREELAKMDNEPKAGVGEGMTGKSFTPAQQQLFKKLNDLAQKGIDDSSSAYMRHVGFDKLDPGEAIVLVHALGYMSEAQFKQVLSTLEFLLDRFLMRDYNPDRNGLAVRPFQAVVVLYCEWSRMVPTRNGHVPVCTMATLTSAPEASQVVPTPLAGESSSAMKQTMAIDNGELVVQGPQGATKITRPPITEALQVWMTLANIKALLCAVHPTTFALQTLLSVEFMCTKAVARDSGGGIFEASLVLAQCFLWLGTSVSRHLRLVGSIEGFTFALTSDQARTIEDATVPQRSAVPAGAAAPGERVSGPEVEPAVSVHANGLTSRNAVSS